MTQSFTTPGVFQENFDFMGQPNAPPNPFLVKLNSNGQLIWSTYLRAQITDMAYHNGALYLVTGRNANPSLNTLATSGSFQSTISDFAITKMNTSTGQRE